jgi:hypothetical protein
MLVLFSTTEGHTRKIAQFDAARLRGGGHEVGPRDAVDSDLPNPTGCDAAFLLASVHLGRYHYSCVKFARNNHNALNVIPTAFYLSFPVRSRRQPIRSRRNPRLRRPHGARYTVASGVVYHGLALYFRMTEPAAVACSKCSKDGGSHQ